MDADTSQQSATESFKHCFSQKKAEQFYDFLNALREAQAYAEDLRCSHWEFAIGLTDALTMRLYPNDLRWMVHKGWIQCASSDHKTNRAPSNSPIRVDAESHFILGHLGLTALQLVENQPAERMTGVDQLPKKILGHLTKPCWDAERHELSLYGRIVKRYRWPATNQEKILAAFEEEAWPPRIDDPLPLVVDIEPKRRLSDSIKCLNRNQFERLIRFRGDGTGEGILWDESIGSRGVD